MKNIVLLGTITLTVVVGIVWFSRRPREPKISNDQFHQLQERFRSLDAVS